MITTILIRRREATRVTTLIESSEKIFAIGVGRERLSGTIEHAACMGMWSRGIRGRISDICLQGCLRGWAWAGAGALLTEGLTLPEMRDASRDLTRAGAGADPAMPLLSCLVVSSAATRKVVGARAFKGPPSLPPFPSNDQISSRPAAVASPRQFYIHVDGIGKMERAAVRRR